jgi:hypothetical protein
MAALRACGIALFAASSAAPRRRRRQPLACGVAKATLQNRQCGIRAANRSGSERKSGGAAWQRRGGGGGGVMKNESVKAMKISVSGRIKAGGGIEKMAAMASAKMKIIIESENIENGIENGENKAKAARKQRAAQTAKAA